MMTKKKKLCRKCETTAKHPGIFWTPPHLVHPVTRTPNLYDMRGHAECPDCRTLWRRSPRGASMLA
jgi:hypothetical protein